MRRWPCASTLATWVSYSRPLCSPESSRMRSRITLPQLPCTLLSPFSARVRFSASSLMRRFRSFSAPISCSSRARPSVSPVYTSSTRRRNSDSCSRSGPSVRSSAVLLSWLKRSAFSWNRRLAMAPNSRPSFSRASASSANFSAAARDSAACRAPASESSARAPASAWRNSSARVSWRATSASRRAASRSAPSSRACCAAASACGGAREPLERRALAQAARLQHERAQQQAQQERRRGHEHVIQVGDNGMHCSSVMAGGRGRLYESATTISL